GWVRQARLQGCLASTLAPPAAPSPPQCRGGNWQTSDASRRENAEAWLFEVGSKIVKRTSAHILRCHRPARPGDPVIGTDCDSHKRRCLLVPRIRGDDSWRDTRRIGSVQRALAL